MISSVKIRGSRTEPQRPRMPPAFIYRPLPNPATHIRLLTAVVPVGPNNMLSFRMSDFEMDFTPPYNAISYTWGEPIMREILVNGYLQKVNQNGYDALVQALNFDAVTCIWIDTVCIDQSSVPEKNEQVRRMFEIYRNATQVLACVGDSDQHSRYLSSVALTTDLVDIDLSLDLESNKRNAAKLLGRMMKQVQAIDLKDFLTRTATSLNELGSRGYWKRLWIIQEVAAGDIRTLILCGTDSIKLGAISRINHMLNLVEPYECRPMTGMLHVLRLMALAFSGSATDRAQSIVGWVTLDFQPECQDPRDRIYASIALIDWEQDGLDPIIPDYSISAWSIAAQLVRTLPAAKVPTCCSNIMEYLEIDETTSELRDLIEDRKSLTPPGQQNTLTRRYEFSPGFVASLWEDSDGTLRCALGTSKNRNSLRDGSFDAREQELLRLLELVDQPEYDWCDQPGRKPRKVFSKDKVVALVCGTTLPGDILVLCNDWHGMNESGIMKGIILRPTSSHALDVVGAGLISTEATDQAYTEATISGFDTSVHDMIVAGNALSHHSCMLILNATAEDLMLFSSVYSHRHPKYSRRYAKDSRQLLHLVTRPVNAPKGAARLIPTHWQEHNGDGARRRNQLTTAQW